MTVEGESELRMALRHVQTGRRCIMRQFNVVATLRSKGLPTAEAETVLQWLEETQQTFEVHYQKVLSDGFAGIEAANDTPPRSDARRLTLVESMLRSLRIRSQSIPDVQ